MLLLAAALIAANAQDHYSYGQATSSQSIIRHDNSHTTGYNQPTAAHAPVYQSVPIHQTALTVQNAGPIISHATPLTSHASPVISHTAPAITSHISPINSQASIVSHASPYITHDAPIVHQALPISHYSSPVLTLQHDSGHYNQQYAQGHQQYYVSVNYYECKNS